MLTIKVLGPGCANCKNTLALVEQVARDKGVAIKLEKIEDLPTIMGYGVMATPGVVIDGVWPEPALQLDQVSLQHVAGHVQRIHDLVDEFPRERVQRSLDLLCRHRPHGVVQLLYFGLITFAFLVDQESDG